MKNEDQRLKKLVENYKEAQIELQAANQSVVELTRKIDRWLEEKEKQEPLGDELNNQALQAREEADRIRENVKQVMAKYAKGEVTQAEYKETKEELERRLEIFSENGVLREATHRGLKQMESSLLELHGKVEQTKGKVFVYLLKNLKDELQKLVGDKIYEAWGLQSLLPSNGYEPFLRKFFPQPEFEEHSKRYKKILKEILNEDI